MAIGERLVEVEHDSDSITHELYNKINSSFITPFDREDIYRLGSGLDDVMDHLEAIGTFVYLYGLSLAAGVAARDGGDHRRAGPAGQGDRRRDAAAQVDA